MYPQFEIQLVNQPEQKKQRPILEKKQQRPEGISLNPKLLDVWESSFILIILGGPGAGKSSLISSLISNSQFLGNKYNKVLFIGPTKYHNLIQDEGNTKKNIDMKWIMKQIEMANEWDCQNMLIVFDDVVSSLKSQPNEFIDLFFNRRHLLKKGTISILISGQKWTMIPTFLRQIVNLLIMFPLAKMQIQSISRQCSINLSRQILNQYISHMERHQFIFSNIVKQKSFDSKWNQI